jgi:hypothetical protein
MKMTVFCDVAPCSLVVTEVSKIALLMEAISISETSVNFYQNTRQKPEDILHIWYCENMKSHFIYNS